MTVAIVTDSAASLPNDLVERFKIGVVPLHVMVGDHEYTDGEIENQEVIARLGEGVSTSGPSPGEFAQAIERAFERADEVLVLTIAGTMSSTYESASLASRSLGEDQVRVVDTRTAAGAEALVVLAAAKQAEAGASLDEVTEFAQRAMKRVRLIATIDNLDQLVRSGRVPNLAGVAGRYLGVNPLFEFREGKARPLRPAFSRDAALDRIVDACRGDNHHGARLHLAALHAADRETAERLLNAASYDQDPAEAFIGSFSAGMIAHTGPGLAGLAWWWEEGEESDD